MKSIRVQDATGMVLCHDVTEIIPGKFKGPSFRKGHVIQSSDIDQPDRGHHVCNPAQ